MEKAKQEIAEGKDRKLWRVSSTLFSHLNCDQEISPIEELKHLHVENAATKYPTMTARDKLMVELNATKMTL